MVAVRLRASVGHWESQCDHVKGYSEDSYEILRILTRKADIRLYLGTEGKACKIHAE